MPWQLGYWSKLLQVDKYPKAELFQRQHHNVICKYRKIFLVCYWLQMVV